MNDPMLPGLKEPTAEGVLRAKLMLEAGFLVASVHDQLGAEIEHAAHRFVGVLNAAGAAPTGEVRRRQQALITAAVRGWRARLSATRG